MPTNENEELISGTTYEYTIDPNAQDFTVQFSLRYADGTEIFDADNNIVSNDIQQLIFNFVEEPTIDGVYGNTSILGELKTGNAKVAFMGDSISNNAATTFTTFWHAALFEWHPDSWKGAWFHPNASNTGMFCNVSLGAFSSDVKRQAGGTDTTVSELNRQGMYLRGGDVIAANGAAVQFQFFANSLSAIQADRSNRDVLARFPDGAQIFEKSDGNRDIATVDNPVSMSARVLAGDDDNYDTTDSTWRLVSPSTAATTAAQFNPTLNTDLTVYGPMIESAPDSTNYNDDNGNLTGNWNLLWASKPAQVGTHWVFDGAFFGGTNDGMTISYFGDGGWTTGSHFPPGDNINIGGVPDTWHYDQEYLRERAAFEELSHVYIHIGQNDIAGGMDRTGAEALANLDLMLSNIRNEIPGVKIVITTIYDTLDDSADNLADKATFNAGIISRAQTSSDMVCVDLSSYIKEQKPDLNTFTDDWLQGSSSDSSSDRVHPDTTGASAMQAYVWSKVEEAAAIGGN